MTPEEESTQDQANQERIIRSDDRSMIMGLRFRKIFASEPLRTTITGKGLGWSIGVPGLRLGIAASGGIYITIGLPGSGFCFTKFLTGRR